MNPFRFLSLALLTLAVVAASPAQAQMIPANDRVRVEVRVMTDSDRKDLAKTTVDTVIQQKTLTISLSGKARERETRVVRWTAYGRDLKNDKVHSIASGEFKLALDAQGKQTGGSREIKTTYTPEHSVVNKKNKGPGQNKQNALPKTKKVEAEGNKFIGYTVQVLDGGKVVGEASDPAGIATAK
jgi:hypothetical protein